jgi:hypothetical protein
MFSYKRSLKNLKRRFLITSCPSQNLSVALLRIKIKSEALKGEEWKLLNKSR